LLSFFTRWSSFILGIMTGIAVIVAVTFDVFWDSERCDQYVATLLHSESEVEVIRAGFLVYKLDCHVQRRLDK
jgi:predicted PurR-regulated permease PerM